MSERPYPVFRVVPRLTYPLSAGGGGGVRDAARLRDDAKEAIRHGAVRRGRGLLQGQAKARTKT
eukprot:8788335-Pyramimonas_sp.AAC.1